MSLYTDCIDAGIPTKNHYCDLYIPVTDATTALVKKHHVRADIFNNRVEGGRWYDIFGAFDPYWIDKMSKG